MSMDMQELERRLTALEDVEAIKKLKARYCAYCDDNYNADGIAALFTEDALWDGGSFGRFEGRQAIRDFFRKAPQLLTFAIHQVLNPIIEVDGDKATGSWYLFQPCTLAQGNQAMWLSARYNEDYVKLGGDWKFKRLRVDQFFFTPFDQGWVKKRFPS